MNSSSRVIINTLAQYFKTFVNIILTLYSTRLILQVLGVEDFGIYTLLAGVVSMLSFATNALATTTQRFLSFYQGKSGIEEQKNVFANSFYIHIALGLVTLCVLLVIAPYLFDGFLNIPNGRESAAKDTYFIVAVILLVTFLSTPYRAVLVSHENIVYLTFIDILDGILKVIMAISLSYVTYDKLVSYSSFMLFIQCVNLIAIGVYASVSYEECIMPSVKRIKRKYINEITSFAGWTIYSIGCVIGRTQGVAIVINKFYGAAINASYGLGFQISGYVNFLSESLLNAIRPQLMRAEGAGQRSRMLWLAEIASKYSFFLLSCLAVPCVFEMDTLLALWLGAVPEYAVMFCRMVLIASMVDTLTCGLVLANQAVGNVKQYSLAVNTIKILTLPAILFSVMVGLPLSFVAVIFVFFECMCALLRIPFVAKTGKLKVGVFIRNVFGKLLLPFLIFLFITAIVSKSVNVKFGFLLSFIVPVIVYVLMFYLFGLKEDEKDYIIMFLKKVKNHG